MEMLKDVCINFCDQLRNARANALRDAEGYDEVLFAIEALGSFLCNKIGTLWIYEEKLTEFAKASAMYEVPQEFRDWHMPFASLYDVVRNGRNDAMHQGVAARHLTNHAVQLALILEDALMKHATTVGDYMVRNPVFAQMWQPLSFVRRQMLAESFSYLPIEKDDRWHLISDDSIALYLRIDEDSTRRKVRMMETVKTITNAGNIILTEAQIHHAKTPLEEVLCSFNGKPVLVCQEDKPSELVGILTAFDLL